MVGILLQRGSLWARGYTVPLELSRRSDGRVVRLIQLWLGHFYNIRHGSSLRG